MKTTFYSNGKLLLTGEYVVLDGASAIVIPTKYGQTLQVTPSAKEGIHWESRDENDLVWYTETFLYQENGIIAYDKNNPVSRTLHKIMMCAKQLNPSFLRDPQGWAVTTQLDFPRNWGLGTSSTLINNIAQWAGVDAFTLLAASYGGSGFDIAAAQHHTPIRYRLLSKKPVVEAIELEWPFKDQLFFVHLNQKQDSKAGISAYKKAVVNKDIFNVIDVINQELLDCRPIAVFEKLLQRHEELISETIQIPTVKSLLFPEYPRSIKSLGAWGGDFVLATGGANEKDYFRKKGYLTIIDFADMVK